MAVICFVKLRVLDGKLSVNTTKITPIFKKDLSQKLPPHVLVRFIDIVFIFTSLFNLFDFSNKNHKELY